MAKKRKKKLKLKKNIKKIVIILILIMILSIIGFKVYKDYKYRQTYEYKLINIGYTKEESDKLQNKLLDRQIKTLIEKEERDKYVVEFINEKYFLNKNLEKYLDYREHNKKSELSRIVAIINVGADKKWYKDTVNTDTSKGNLMLVNKFHLLTPDYVVGELKTFESSYSYGEVKATKECYEAFVNMAEAAKKDKINLIVTSGFRTYEHQEEVYEEMRNYHGKNYADAYAARAGASEHETGLALDVFTYGATTDSFENTDTYKWLDAHAHEYGFIRRYLKDREYLTGYEPESWHYRYVGIDIASKVKEEGITYDEYYAYYIE